MSKQDNQPAFPATEEHGCNSGCSGMTLRQYAAIKLKVPDSGTDWLDEMIRESLHNDFASSTLQGLCTRPNIDIQNTDYRAALAYEQANTMLMTKASKA